MFILIFLIYGIIIAFESIALKNGKNKGKFILYLSAGSLGLIISGLLTLGIEIPSPSDLIKNTVYAIFD
jgi:hypothetical protein